MVSHPPYFFENGKIEMNKRILKIQLVFSEKETRINVLIQWLSSFFMHFSHRRFLSLLFILGPSTNIKITEHCFYNFIPLEQGTNDLNRKLLQL